MARNRIDTFEKEWRDVCYEPAGLQPFPGPLTPFVLGTKMPQDHRAVLQKLFAGEPMEFRRGGLSKAEYSVKLELVS